MTALLALEAKFQFELPSTPQRLYTGRKVLYDDVCQLYLKNIFKKI